MERAVNVESTKPDVRSDDVWTVRRVMQWTIGHLEKHGSDTPRLDTEILLAHARGCQRIELYTHYDELLTDDERAVMRDLVQRRANAEPVAYLVRHREFFSLQFRVTPDVMIPRPETETLVMEALDLAKLSQPRILDVGTGSGCIAIALAVNYPQAQITATDIHAPVLEVARDNAKRHAALDQIRLLQGDLFAPLETNEQFDIVISNPPYVAEAEFESLEAEVRHEPRLALDGGPDGLNVVRPLIDDAPAHLANSGHLLLEISPEQASKVCDLLEVNGSYTDIELRNDLAGRIRVVRAKKRL